MHFPIVIFQWLVTIADAIIYAVISFFGAIIIIIANTKLSKCWPLKMEGFAPNFPDNFPKAITDAENVIAPMKAPMNNSNL